MYLMYVWCTPPCPLLCVGQGVCVGMWVCARARAGMQQYTHSCLYPGSCVEVRE